MDATQVDEEVIHTIVIIALVYYNTRILYNERVKEWRNSFHSLTSSVLYYSLVHARGAILGYRNVCNQGPNKDFDVIVKGRRRALSSR